MSIEAEPKILSEGAFEKPTEEELAVGRVFESVETIDANLELSEQAFSRLVLLELHSKFNHDSRLIKLGMQNVLEKIADKEQGYGITTERIKEACMAAIIHDIGKSGPLSATPGQQLSIIKLYAEESLENPKQLVKDAVGQTFGSETEQVLLDLERCGIDTETTMMWQFWQSHAKWGYEIIETECENFSDVTRKIAILHHADKGPAFNFLGVPMDQIPKESLALGALKDCVDILRQRAIVALDQYEARIRRSKVTHEEAVGWVRKNVSQTFGNDAFMNEVLDIMEEMGTEKIFGEMVN